MAKEFDRIGIPAAQICTIVPIAQTVGANRIIKAIAIPHPVGNPSLSESEEIKVRRKIVFNAIKALETEIEVQTVF